MIKIIGGPHQGFKTDRVLHVGESIRLNIYPEPCGGDISSDPGGDKVIDFDYQDYSIRVFNTGNPKIKIQYAAPIEWDNEACFRHMLSLVGKP